MSDTGLTPIAKYRWDASNNKWVKDLGSTAVDLQNVQISGVTPVDGKLPVDTELIVEGDIIVQDVDIQSAPLTEITPSGTIAGVDRHDYRSLSYTNGLITQIVYKSGGSGGSTVSTRTLTYNADNTMSTDTVV